MSVCSSGGKVRGERGRAGGGGGLTFRAISSTKHTEKVKLKTSRNAAKSSSIGWWSIASTTVFSTISKVMEFWWVGEHMRSGGGGGCYRES